MNGQVENGQTPNEAADAPEQYEAAPEELTSLKPGPARFDRKKVVVSLCIGLSVIVALGLVFSTGKAKRREAEESTPGYAARTPRDFLQGELDRSLRSQEESGDGEAVPAGSSGEEADTGAPAAALPQAVPVSYNGGGAAHLAPGGGRREVPDPPPGPSETGGGGGRTPAATAPFSALVPSIEGSLFPGTMPPSPSYAEQYPYLMPGAGTPPAAYGYPQSASAAPPASAAAQNNRADTTAFYGSAAVTGGSQGGLFLQDDLVWIGSIIPAVLETSVNTDLPGNVIARVSENVYDSRTGQKLLIPQGTLLFARYNSSVSYAQRRVQIVWDLLIRPDGYQVELGGQNAVDERGMAGVKAEYRENWFEYLKAAGLITMFSLANAQMAGETARYGSAEMAAGVAASNAEFVAQIGGSIVSRAMNIQPTLILTSGEKINVMLTKNLYLPPVENYPVTKPYILK
jgi:type IV secretion system protein VirB10